MISNEPPLAEPTPGRDGTVRTVQSDGRAPVYFRNRNIHRHFGLADKISLEIDHSEVHNLLTQQQISNWPEFLGTGLYTTDTVTSSLRTPGLTG